MRFTTLNEDTITQLLNIVKTDKRHKSRLRAQALLLSNQGKKIPELVEILGVSQRSIYRWFDRFNQDNINTLHELSGRCQANGKTLGFIYYIYHLTHLN